MKIRLVFAFVGFAISLAVPTFAQEQNAVDPEVRQQIEDAYKNFHDAYNKHDAAAVAALFTLDAVEVIEGRSEGGLSSGQEAIKKMFEIELASGSTVSGKIVQVYAVGSAVCAISEFTSQRHHTGSGVTIFVRDADEWKIRMQYSN